MKKPSSDLARSFLSISALIFLGCGSTSDSTDGDSNSTEQKSSESPSTQPLHKHAKLIPEDAWLVATVRPRQILGKLDYESVIPMPDIAFLYSAMSPGFGSEFDLEDEDCLRRARHCTQCIRKSQF